MAITNLAVGQQINLAGILNTKLEAPLHQSEMGLDAMATALGEAIRYDEFSLKHNNNGTFKAGIIANADISATASITSNKLAIQSNYKKGGVSNPSATANTDGTMVTLLPATNYVSMFPQAVDVVFGGTFGAETVTATVNVTYFDATTTMVTKTATAVGTTSFTNSDLMSLIKDATYIKQIDVYSQSTIASSTATVTINHCGFYL